MAGATGAIAKQLVPRLGAAGHEVHGMTHREAEHALVGDDGGVWSFTHGGQGVHNIVDDDPARWGAGRGI